MLQNTKEEGNKWTANGLKGIPGFRLSFSDLLAPKKERDVAIYTKHDN